MSILDDFHRWRDAPIRQRAQPGPPRAVRLPNATECPCGTPIAPATAVSRKYCSEDCVPSGGIDYELTNDWRWRPEDLNEDHRTLVKVNGWDWGDGLTLSLLLPEETDDAAAVKAHLRLDDGVHYVGRDWGVAVELLSDPDALYLHAAEIAPRLLAELTRGAAYAETRPSEPYMLTLPDVAWTDIDTSPEVAFEPIHPRLDLSPTAIGRRYVRRMMPVPRHDIYIVLVDVEAQQAFPLAIIEVAPPSFVEPWVVTPPFAHYALVGPEELQAFARMVIGSPYDHGSYPEHVYRQLQSWLAHSPLSGAFWRVPAGALELTSRFHLFG